MPGVDSIDSGLRYVQAGMRRVFSRRSLFRGAAALTATSLLTNASASEASSKSAVCASSRGEPPTPRQNHTATLLPTGLILVIGGLYLGALSDVQLYDPNVDLWYPAAPLLTPRSNHATVVLSSTQILVTGGQYESTLSTCEVYDLGADSWTSVNPLATPRYGHAAVLFGDGSVRIFGGYYKGALTDVETYVLA